MQVFYSSICAAFLGYLIGKIKIGDIKAISNDKFFIYSSIWVFAVIIIDLSFNPETFYSNDQKVFLKALLQFDSAVSTGLRTNFDFRYVSSDKDIYGVGFDSDKTFDKIKFLKVNGFVSLED